MIIMENDAKASFSLNLYGIKEDLLLIYEKDWFMMQIKMMVQLVTKLFLGKDTDPYKIADEEHLSEADMLYRDLKALTAEGKINEAENLLFESIVPNQEDFLTVALDFYASLNLLSDEELEAHDFSREEIKSGLEDAIEACGYNLPAIL